MELILIKVLYLMFPVYMANMMPVIVRSIPFLDIPVDFGKKIRNRRIFGAHKTWRGLIFGTAAAILIAYIQFRLDLSISLLEYEQWVIIGLFLGGGALLGDLLKSMIKRQLKIKEGKPFIPWDQLDFLLGALPFLLLLYIPTPAELLTMCIITPILHITINHIAFYLKIRKEKW
ncbi:MAG: CDP-2,3-bis-(O-geranylgeranyl)-sn-glycerol synthase [Candidatus Woesearchaeota archaeon]